MHLIEQAHLQELAHHRGAAADPRFFAAARACFSAASIPSVTNWNTVPPSLDRRPRVMSEHVHRRVIGRIGAPPARPGVVRPWTADWAEHVSPHDPGALGIGSRDGRRMMAWASG